MKKEFLTVGFAEIGKFYSSNETDIERIIGLLQSFYQVTGNVIQDYGGQIVKYIGNSIFFVFQSPKKAIAAAEKIAELEIAGLKIYASLATGEVFCGKFGHSTFQVEDILGPPVGKAVLLIEEAKELPNRFAMCETTLEYKNHKTRR